MRHQLLFAAVVVASLAGRADAHFVLVAPAASLVQNRLGDPQKIAPCGGVSANPGRGTPANPGVPSGAVIAVKGGSNLPLLVQETIFHPGHYRVANSLHPRLLRPKQPAERACRERPDRRSPCKQAEAVSRAGQK